MSKHLIINQLLETLIAEYNYLTKDKPKKIRKLFNQLEQESKKIEYDYKVALENSNMIRNRYSDILPHGKTRFSSKNLPYINANIINNKYILTQGPMAGFIDEFWTMIFDSGTNIIVCLASQIENSWTKFDPYFDDNKEEMYGQFRVKVEKIIKFEKQNLIIRKLFVTPCGLIPDKKCVPFFSGVTKYKIHSKPINLSYSLEEHFDKPDIDFNSGDTRIINHIQYIGWPDHGLPANTSNFLKILGIIDKLSEPHLEQSITVHCSAGIGRSGTITVVKKVLDKVKLFLNGKIPSIDKINIFEQVLSLRRYRQGLVQGEEQFEFCYLAIIAGIKLMLSERK